MSPIVAQALQESGMCQVNVLKVERVENRAQWAEYAWHKERLCARYARRGTPAAVLDAPAPAVLKGSDPAKSLDPTVNEVYLFHGTTRDFAQKIIEQGLHVVAQQRNGMHFCGDARTALQEYARIHPGKGGPPRGRGGRKAHADCEGAAVQDSSVEGGSGLAVVVCRVLLGDPYYAIGPCPERTRPPQRVGAVDEEWDSVIAELPGPRAARGTHTAGQAHRDYVVYQPGQAYPEFIATLA